VEDGIAVTLNDVDVKCSPRPATYSNVILSNTAPNTLWSPDKRDLSLPTPFDPVAESNTGHVEVVSDHTNWPVVINYDGAPPSLDFTQDTSLLSALPCWCNAEIIQDWDMQWEQNLGFTDLPEELELVYRPASTYTNPVVQPASEEPHIQRLVETTLECCEVATDVTLVNHIIAVKDENHVQPIQITPEHQHQKLFGGHLVFCANLFLL